MRRREVVQFLGAALALPFIPRGAQAAIKLGEDIHLRLAEAAFRTLDPDQRALVTNIAEMIIPETDTPGATSVKVPEFIDLILTERATDEEKAAFLAGLHDIDVRAAAIGSPRFVALPAAKKVELLTALDAARGDKAGAGLAFLWFNAYPAEVFMGDVGALALGAALGMVALVVRQEIVLLIMGGVFVVETLSVIIQVASFKLTGKRVFRMAPLHHHYELKGWKENQVVVRFWIITMILVLFGLSTLKLR